LKGAIGQYLQQHFQRYLEPHLGRHGWIWLPLVGSMAANGLLIGFSSRPTVLDNIALAAIAPSRPISRPAAKPTSKPAPATKRASVHKPTYQDWVRLLGREAEAMAKRNPEHLTILAGDSLSLWFPDRLLPVNQEWLNQGISGETSKGLLHRINLWKKLKPDRIFLMVGINDLLRGESDKVILAACATTTPTPRSSSSPCSPTPEPKPPGKADRNCAPPATAASAPSTKPSKS
jgi:hypothetical protein